MTEFHIKTAIGQEFTCETDAPLLARGLDGIFYRVRVNGEWQPKCLTDLPWPICREWLGANAAKAPNAREYLLSAIEHLHSRLRSMGDQLDISTATGAP